MMHSDMLLDSVLVCFLKWIRAFKIEKGGITETWP